MPPIKNINFLAIDFETATSSRTSVCEVGICVVRNGEVAETRSWLVRPEDNRYHYRNIQIHGIRPEDTEDAPDFRQVWEEIERTYLDEFNMLVHTMCRLTGVACSTRLHCTGCIFHRWSGNVLCRRPARFMLSGATRWTIFATGWISRREHTTVQATMPRCVHGSICGNWRIWGKILKKPFSFYMHQQ